MQLFRTQRNYWLSFFNFTVYFVLWRYSSLLSKFLRLAKTSPHEHKSTKGTKAE
jgi:hypothetical protein